MSTISQSKAVVFIVVAIDTYYGLDFGALHGDVLLLRPKYNFCQVFY